MKDVETLATQVDRSIPSANSVQAGSVLRPPHHMLGEHQLSCVGATAAVTSLQSLTDTQAQLGARWQQAFPWKSFTRAPRQGAPTHDGSCIP